VTGSALTIGNTLIINGVIITLTGQTLTSLVNDINNSGVAGVTAETNLTRTSNKLWLYADADAESDGSSAEGGIINIDTASTAGLLTTLGITATSYLAPALQQSPNYTVPRWRTTDTGGGRPTGSVWNMTTAVNQGADFILKKYSAALGIFVQQPCPIYANDQSANQALDPAGGGRNIPAGTTYAQPDVSPQFAFDEYNNEKTNQEQFSEDLQRARAEKKSEEITVIVNKEKIINLTTKPGYWAIRELGNFNQITHVRVDNNKKVIYEIKFDDDFREIFKIKSYITNA
jgi:hypothetical protein